MYKKKIREGGYRVYAYTTEKTRDTHFHRAAVIGAGCIHGDLPKAVPVANWRLFDLFFTWSISIKEIIGKLKWQNTQGGGSGANINRHAF